MRQLTLDIGLTSGPTLENFLPGRNAQALEHLRLQTGGARPSPVPSYLWGPPACGKTHLLSAVRAGLESRGLPVAWLAPGQGADFVVEQPWAALLIDDAERLSALEQQQAFQGFVQALTPEDGQPRWVLAAGSLPPARLALREDLRTRLGWGVVHELQPLDEAQTRAVLRQRAEARGLVLGDEVLDFLLARFSRDLGSLTQLLEQLDGYALRTRRALTIPLVKAMLQEE